MGDGLSWLSVVVVVVVVLVVLCEPDEFPPFAAEAPAPLTFMVTFGCGAWMNR
jgi:hypothetical protein